MTTFLSKSGLPLVCFHPMTFEAWFQGQFQHINCKSYQREKIQDGQGLDIDLKISNIGP